MTMLQRYKQLMSEAMTAIPAWDEKTRMGTILLGSGYRRGQPNFMDKKELFPETSEADYKECCRILNQSVRRAPRDQNKP